MLSLHFVKANSRWLMGGFFLTLSSTFGQTFFISLFSVEIRLFFNISHGEFGLIYMFGTLASAATLMFVGKVTDNFPTVHAAAITLCLLAITAFFMSVVQTIWLLTILIFALRLLGQGMCGHIAMTAMGKWYSKQRGQAVSIAALGIQIGEGIIPPVTVLLITTLGWHVTWQITTCFLLLVSLPIVYATMRKEREPSQEEIDEKDETQQQWQRKDVLADPYFYLIILAMITPAFIATSVFFHQNHLAELKSWSRLVFPAHQFILAISAVFSTLFFGRFVDKYSATQLLPLSLLPLALAILFLGSTDQLWVISVFMALLGMTFGISSNLFGSICPELYGTKHLGAIRSMFTALMVFSSALGPGLTGAMIDIHIGLEQQLLIMAGYCLILSALMLPVSKKLLIKIKTQKV
jgi:sugar phosphate permease